MMVTVNPQLWNLLADQASLPKIASQLNLSESEAGQLVCATIRELQIAYADVCTTYGATEGLVTSDPVTGVETRQAAERYLEWAIGRCRQAHAKLAVIFADVDRLKQVNDQQGHQAGDAVLRAVAHALCHNLRHTDHVFRWGGDEFLVVLPDADAPAATTLLERIRQYSPTLRLSAGVAQWQPGDTVLTLVDRADRAMYANKRQRARD